MVSVGRNGEAADGRGSEQVRTVYSRWFNSAQSAVVRSISSAMLRHLSAVDENEDGAVLTVRIEDSQQYGKYFLYAPAGVPNYASASSVQKETYGWYADATDTVGASNDDAYTYS